MRRGLFAIACVAGCNDAQQNAPTQLDLDRPVDIAFACYGGLRLTNGFAATVDQEITVTAQPAESCTIRSGAHGSSDPIPTPPGQESLTTSGGKPVPNATWYAFILQSAPGTVTLASFETKPSSSFGGGDVQMVDSDPLTPGKNGISVGENPIAIATDSVGCFEVIANQGSCDLSALDVNSAVNGSDATSGAKPIVTRNDVKNSLGQVIRARPVAMAFQPAGGTIGQVCPAQPTGLAYIAYPSCHLVAGVDVATNTIVTGIQFDDMGNATVVDGTVTCPAECDGAGPTPGTRPVALDLEQDERTGRVVLAIGADNSNRLTYFDLDPSLYRPLGTGFKVDMLEMGQKLGLTSVAITPVIGMGGDSGVINDDSAIGGDHQFIYATATDGTVRVADIATAPHECDTQVDPRFLHEVRDVSLLSCFAVNDPLTPPRRPNARGPGIELVGDGVPTSVDVFRVDPVQNDSRSPGTPLRLIGYFGVITSSDGRNFVFNVDNDDFADWVDPQNVLGTPIPLDIAHQLRDNIPDRGALAESGGQLVCDDAGPDPDATSGNSAGPRSPQAPARTLPAGVIADEKLGNTPLIQQVMCNGADGEVPVSELFFSAPIATRDQVFPDLRGLRSDENWSLTWEGSLSLDKSDTAIDGPAVRISDILVDSFGMHLVDGAHPYCDAGVEPYDVVQIRGCDPTLGDAGCPAGYTCYVHPQSQVTGIGACILASEAERLQNACKEYLTSLRRYTVGRAKSGELLLMPRKHVLRTTPIDGCIDDAQCQTLANYGATNASSSHPFEDKTPPDTHSWTCQIDQDRAPVPGTGKRCIETCDSDADCEFGAVCHANPASGRTGYCMEGVVPPQSCVNAPQRYELRAGEAFAVVGSRQGFMHPIIADANGNCVKDPNANPYMVGRIPLFAPPCDPSADPRTGKRIDGTFEPNPCQLTVPEAEFKLNYSNPNSCTLGTPAETPVTRDAVAIRLRNRALTLTVVDPTYPGDARCNGDRGGSLVNVPIVTPGFQMTFRQTAGFLPLILPIQPSFPIKVVRGPTESIWVIDEGDYLSTSITQASTRGKVFRVESRALSVVNLLE